jgi:hypothetical protein
VASGAPPPGHLRRAVPNLGHHGPGGRQARVVQSLRQAEVRELDHAPNTQEHVGGRQIPMDDRPRDARPLGGALDVRVGSLQRAQHLDPDGRHQHGRGAYAEGCTQRGDVPQGEALDPLGDQVQPRGVEAEIQGLHHIGVVEHRVDLRLPDEERPPLLRARQVCMHALHRHGAVKTLGPELLGAPDVRHGAPSGELHEMVPPAHERTLHIQQLNHWTVCMSIAHSRFHCRPLQPSSTSRS